jgi:AAA domain/Homeodomain-like domain
MIPAERINFAALMEPVALRLLGEPNARLSKPPRDVRFGSHGSMAVNFEDGEWYDHENKIGGGVLDLIQHKTDRNRGEAQAWLRKEGFSQPALTQPSPAPHAAERIFRKVGANYDYPDERGELLFQVVRYEPKEFRQRRPDGNGGWEWSLGEVRRVLYKLPDLLTAIEQGETIYIVEGEKDVHALLRNSMRATCNPGGAGKWRAEYCGVLRDAHIVIVPDNDEPGRRHAEQVAAALHGVARRMRVLDLAAAWPACPSKGGDISDWFDAGHSADELRALTETLPDWKPRVETPQTSVACERLRPLDLEQFLQLSIKPREMLLDPILPEKGLAMLYAVRGTGKTHVAIGICFAIAAGTKFLKWSAPRPRRVLLIDGEMPAAALQERLASVVASVPDVDLDPDNIRILAGDLIETGGIGNLASPGVQEELDQWLDGIDVLILDNLSSLTAVIRDNEAESWGPIQEWLLKLRRRGISVLIVHHAGKGGQQRGTSRREDVLDTSISLRRPADYSPTDGARFEVHLEKARGVYGDAAKPFEAKLEVRDGAAVWTTREVEDANRARVQALLDDGLSVRDIADETGIPKSTVHRIKKAFQAAEGGTDAEQ